MTSPDMEDELLRTDSLSRSFGGLQAVDRVNFVARKGELHSVIGPNGAGKSTLLNLIAGGLRPTSGRIWFRSRNIAGLPRHTVVRLGISKTYQITTIFKNLTVYENVRVSVQSRYTTYDVWTRAEAFVEVNEKAEAILRAIQLSHRRDVISAQLSHGEQRHLEIGIALGCDPVLLLLDEPTAGMSPRETEQTIHLIKDLARERAVVLVEHKMSVVMSISDTITVLHNGRILAEGTPSTIQESSQVQEVYLGGVTI